MGMMEERKITNSVSLTVFVQKRDKDIFMSSVWCINVVFLLLITACVSGGLGWQSKQT